jgi:hypothetical protein
MPEPSSLFKIKRNLPVKAEIQFGNPSAHLPCEEHNGLVMVWGEPCGRRELSVRMCVYEDCTRAHTTETQAMEADSQHRKEGRLGS